MFVRGFGWGRLALGLILGSLVFGTGAVAQTYFGATDCGSACHGAHMDIYDQYMQHGHPWIEVATGGQEPGADLFGFASVGKTLPDPAAYLKRIPDENNPGQFIDAPMTWQDIAAVLGNFGENAPTVVRMSDGRRVSAGGSSTGSVYTPRCFRCHNPTGYVADTALKMYDIAAWTGGAPATDLTGKRMNGVQCEHCHGAGMTMLKPDGHTCTDCHSRTDPDPFNPAGNWNWNREIPFAPTADGTTGVFTNHHPQGDETRKSPHKGLGCTACHDPHKSVWKGLGGVKYANGVASASADAGVGNMCLHCHQNKRVRGSMGEGEFALSCVECHMPHKSGGAATAGIANDPHGHRATHLFKINSTNLKAADNTTTIGTAKYWKSPGPDAKDPNLIVDAALEGDAFLTLDMVCADCHHNMSIDQMASYAPAVHRQPGLVDLTVNNRDSLQVVARNAQVKVDCSIERGEQYASGVNAQWWVMAQTPKGWSSWNGKKWAKGLRPWRKSVPLTDAELNVLTTTKLAPGYYTYWACIYPTDGSEHYDAVPLVVKKAPPVAKKK